VLENFSGAAGVGGHFPVLIETWPQILSLQALQFHVGIDNIYYHEHLFS
jgi:hypothetical protein